MRAFAFAAMALAASGAAAEEPAFDCLMDPARTVEVGSPITGLVDEVLVDRGDVVRKGQPIARLASQIEESTVDLLALRAGSTQVLERQREQVASVSRRYERVKTLREQGLTPQEQVDAVEADLIAARALLAQEELAIELAKKELARAEAALEQRVVRAPIDAIVAEQLLTGGEYVSQDLAILRLVQLDPLHVEVFVPVALFGHVEVGDSATVRPAPPVDGEFVARVTVVDRVFDPASGMFGIRLELPNPDGKLPAGHRCRISLSVLSGG